MKRTIIGLATACVAVLGLTACGSSSNPVSGSSGASGAPSPAGTITIGSGNFTESTLLADIYVAALTAKGVKVNTKLDIGNREAYFPALKSGTIDLIPEYSGTLLQYLNANATEVASDPVYAALQKALPSNLTVLNQAAAEDKDAIVVTKATSDKYHLTSMAQLGPICGQLTFGGPPELKTRPDGVPGFKKNYDCTFGTFDSLDAGGPLTVAALKNGQVQAADIFTTDPSIPDNGWVVLADPKNNFAAQNVVPVVNKAKLTPTITAALNAVQAKLDTRTLASLDAQLNAPDKPDPSDVAQSWLKSVGLG
ncbi:MAG TPA: ABC transporter substrate-binding protein [Pseudonocardiaceae bacterium]|jgi:osmoprotectant transport system substrate-binding protein|nr:ABC transporter substrate-binding protein [Pseudonocardiaceae bacterium]